MSDLHVELLFSDHGTDRFDKKLKKIMEHQGDVYIWDDVHPWLTHPNGIEMLEKIVISNTNQLFLVCRGNHGLPKNYLGFNVIEFSHTAIDFIKWHDFFSQKYLSTPNHSRGKFLFLTGKPLGYHRVGLLYKIWKNKLMENCTYSFFGNSNKLKSSCETFIDVKDRESFFLEVKNHSPDMAKVQNTETNNLHYLGIPYDESLYESTQFSVVSETLEWKGPPYHITEKTWRAILNCHPFLLAGQPGIIDYIESLGFNCYRSYLKESYQTNVNNWSHKDNEKLIVNIKHWLSMSEQDWNEIKKIAFQNQKKFFVYLEENKNTFQRILGNGKNV